MSTTLSTVLRPSLHFARCLKQTKVQHYVTAVLAVRIYKIFEARCVMDMPQRHSDIQFRCTIFGKLRKGVIPMKSMKVISASFVQQNIQYVSNVYVVSL